MDCKLVGANINQDDLPWWAVAILGWIAMVKSMRSFTGGKQAAGRKEALELVIKSGNPHKIYKLYDDFEEYAKYLERGGEQEKK
jgi:hypothetical protein